MSLKYQAGDLINTTSDFGGRSFLIFETTPHGYLALETKTKKRYPLQEEQIAAKVGEMSPEETAKLQLELDDYDRDFCETYCSMQARSFPQEAEQWLFFANLKPGTVIYVVHRKTIYPAEFIRINFNKPLYPIRAKIKGLVHDFRLDANLGLQPDQITV